MIDAIKDVMKKLILLLLILISNTAFTKENVYLKKDGIFVNYDSLKINLVKNKKYTFEGFGSIGIERTHLSIIGENIRDEGDKPKIVFKPKFIKTYELNIKGFFKEKCIASQKFYLFVKPEPGLEEPGKELIEEEITIIDTVKAVKEEPVVEEEIPIEPIFEEEVITLIDLNTASLEKLKSLPVSEKQAEDIFNYRFYIQFFKSIYDLREIESIDQKTMNRLKPLLIVSHYDDKDEASQRRDEIAYLIERLGSNEGLQEGMSDVWEDYLMTPRNINKLPFSDILNLPNTSPIDAAAIINRRAVGDSISSYRDLRQSPGISYYGAKNIRYYVYYSEQILAKKIFIDYQMKYNDSPYQDDALEMFKESMIRYEDDPGTPGIKRQSYWGFFNMESDRTSIQNKLRIRYLNEWKAGCISYSSKGEENLLRGDNQDILKDSKYYIGYEKELDFLGRNYLKIYAGNYRATFGEGLVMENTDFYSPRKTGYGFNKRITGITPDISRTQEYALRGLALDWKRDNLNAVFFFSKDNKDAVVYDSNDNGKLDKDDDILSYITMTRRFTDDELESAEEYFNSFSDNYNQVSIAPRKDALEEQIIGGHFEYSPFIGTHIGITGYEAVYNRDFVVPETSELKYLLISVPLTDSIYAEKKWKITDNEISSLYSTRSDEVGDRDYRRVFGFDWRTVLNNTSIQGEYAELEVDGNFGKLGDDPKAIIISAYTQFDNLYLLSMYRNYDLEFDNPYHRSFSESERFDDTVFEKLTYALNNTLLNDMYLNSAQPSAEEGIYFETRYQFHQKLTLTKAYLDIWERKSDARRGIRCEAKLEFKPIHQLRIRLRHKHQVKRYDDDQDRNKSRADETELKLICYLSNFDRLQLGYVYATVLQPPYLSILSDPAQASGPDMAQASTLTNGDMIYVDYTHNFNENLKVIGAFSFWQGHGVSFWDFEDIELDFDQKDRGFKYWFNIHSRISSNLFLSLKYKYKQFLTRELEFRKFNVLPDPDEGEYYFQRVERKENILRLQLDWKF
jgi:DNA uptake protein ComE-like DNA-binding protein